MKSCFLWRTTISSGLSTPDTEKTCYQNTKLFQFPELQTKNKQPVNKSEIRFHTWYKVHKHHQCSKWEGRSIPSTLFKYVYHIRATDSFGMYLVIFQLHRTTQITHLNIISSIARIITHYPTKLQELLTVDDSIHIITAVNAKFNLHPEFTIRIMTSLKLVLLLFWPSTLYLGQVTFNADAIPIRFFIVSL